MIDANAPHSAAPKTDYTPTTTEVRMAYGDSQCVDMDDPAHAHGCPQDADFDRWLAEYTRQQREEAWEEAFWLADWDDDVQWPVNPYRVAP